MAPKQILRYCAIMPIYANQRENGAADIKCFFRQKMLNRQLGKNQKIMEKIFTRFNRKNAKNKIMDPSGPPLCNKC